MSKKRSPGMDRCDREPQPGNAREEIPDPTHLDPDSVPEAVLGVPSRQSREVSDRRTGHVFLRKIDLGRVKSCHADRDHA